MIAIDTKHVESVIDKMKTVIEAKLSSIKTDLQEFKDDDEQLFTAKESEYLDKLYTNFESIVMARPNNLAVYKHQMGELLAESTVKRNNMPSFSNRLVSILDYSGLRSSLYPEYFRKIGIKACVYCNAQLTVVIDKRIELKTKTKIITKAKFQVDHYWPKSLYPCFSISFFNLYPVCASCNNAKSNSIVPFSLYSDDLSELSESRFKFSLEKGCVAKYIASRKSDNLKIKFEEPKVNKGEKGFQRTFGIHGIYDTQKDLVEELILKAETYTDSYKAFLQKEFSGIFSNASLSNRLII